MINDVKRILSTSTASVLEDVIGVSAIFALVMAGLFVPSAF